MKNMWYALAMATGLLLVPSAAKAEGLYFYPYAGVGYGQFSLESTTKATVGGGFVLFGAEVSPYFAPEIRIGKSAKASNADYSAESLDWFVSYLGRLQSAVAEDFTLYGLFGMTTMRTSLTQTAGTKLTNTATKPSYGVGMFYRPTSDLSVDVEWLRMGRGYKASSNQGLNVTTVSGVIRMTF